MAAILSNLRNTVIAAFVLAALVFVLYLSMGTYSNIVFWTFALRWLHVLSGIMWIGLLYYFNFVQIPTMPKVPDELKKGVSGYIAPEALFWFRWGAMFTLIFGLILAWQNNYLVQAYTLGAVEGFTNNQNILIGIGMWLATIMWFNVWFVIWPNQQKALNIGGKYSSLAADQKAKAARLAMLFSRTNTMLSVPMLFCMVSYSHLPA